MKLSLCCLLVPSFKFSDFSFPGHPHRGTYDRLGNTSCVLSAGSYSLGDPQCQRCTFVAVNTDILFLDNMTLSNTLIRGLVIYTYSKTDSFCNFKGPYIFDTHAKQEDTHKLAEFLSSLDNGTVVIGTSLYEFTLNLGPARESLQSIGIDIDCLYFGATLSFISIIGQETKSALRYYIVTHHNGCNAGRFTWVMCSYSEGEYLRDSITITI